MNIDISNDDLKYVAEHIFLPPKLPQNEDPESHRKDVILLDLVAATTDAFLAELKQDYGDIPKRTRTAWKMVSKLAHSMHTLHSTSPLSESCISRQLQSMKVHDVVSIFVSAQNAGIIFRKRSTDRLTFEAFEVSLPNEVVTSTIGKVLVTYPSNPRLDVTTEPEMIESLARAISFFDFTPIPEAIPITRKASTEHEDIRDTVSPRLITEGFAGFLRGVAPSECSGNTTWIQKRIDDHRLINPTGKQEKPWKRSPIWLLVRVALQSTLKEHIMTDDKGYKAFQVYLMAQVLSTALKRDGAITDDVLHVMNTKLAKRLNKMKDLVDGSRRATIKFAADVVLDVSSVLEGRWKKYREASINQINWKAPTKDAIKTGLKFTLKKSQKYLQTVVMRTTSLAQSSTTYDPEATKATLQSDCSCRLSVDSSDLPSDINTEELDISLYDFEAWVERQLPQWYSSSSRRHLDSEDLAAIIRRYYELAASHYKGSPERVSIMWLTLFELWVALDHIITTWCPLLKDYSPEISTEPLDTLLLPYSSQLSRLQTVQCYLTNRQKRGGQFSVFENQSHSQSFANKYFQSCISLQTKKSEIEEWGRNEKEKKLQELDKLNERYYELMGDASRGSCEYQLYKRHEVWERRHSNSCYKCSLENQAHSLRISPFEEPLPSDPYQANAIVFELNCPRSYGIWRDVTYELILGTQSHDPAEEVRLYPLAKYHPLSKFYNTPGLRISAASFNASFHSIYLGNPHHLPAQVSNVVLLHAGKFQLFDTSDAGWLRDTKLSHNLRMSCTLQLDGPYRQLRPFLEGTSHSPNSVVASQESCPRDLSTSEFLSFGLVRSGHRLQWRNLMRALISNSLSFTDGNVLSLVLQTIWQVGPNEHSSLHRDTHSELADPVFVTEAILVLQSCRRRLRNSGGQIFFLATLIALASRLLSLTTEEEAKRDLRSFLDSSRSLAFEWIEEARREQPSSDHEVSRHRHLLSQLVLICRSTYDIEQEELQNVLQSQDNVKELLYLTMLLGSITSGSQSQVPVIQLLLRRDRRFTYRLEEELAKKLDKAHSIVDDAVKKFVFKYASGTRWIPLQHPATRWWHSKTSSDGHDHSRFIFFNIIDGTLLIDGKTEGRMPDRYVSHSSYKLLFGNSLSLPSTPSFKEGMEYQAQYLDNKIHFSMIDDELVVRLYRDGHIEEFIPSKQLRYDIPDSFLADQYLWYVEREEEQWIEFRPRVDLWKPSEKTKAKLRLSMNIRSSRLLGKLERHSFSGIQRAIDPHSQIHSSVHAILRTLEPSNVGIEFLVTEDGEKMIIRLPRHSLDFFLNDHGQIESNSLYGYTIDPDQEIGCLYGLDTYLVLFNDTSAKSGRKLVLPRGTVTAQGTYPGPCVIHIDSSKSNGCFFYDVDTLVGRLLGNRTLESDLFLTQLHGYTSLPIPDPLTGRTGTEEALDRLSSAAMFSFQDFPKNWRDQLDTVAVLTPRREYYPHWSKAMENIEWNSSIPITAQHTAFEAGVTRVLRYWQTIGLDQNRRLHSPRELPPGMIELTQRASIRNSSTGIRQNEEYLDLIYNCRDSMSSQDSMERESAAYRVAYCMVHPSDSIQPCENLISVVKAQSTIRGTQTWSWSHMNEWVSAEFGNAWCTLHELCRRASGHQARFGTIMALSLIAYRQIIPLDIVGTLLLVIKNPAFQQYVIDYDLDMSTGFMFNPTHLHELIESQDIGFDNSEEADLRTAPGQTDWEHYQTMSSAYHSRLDVEVQQIIQTLQMHWPNNISGIGVPSGPRLKDLSTFMDESIRPLLQSWAHNHHFLEHIREVTRRARTLQTPSFSPPSYPATRPSTAIRRSQVLRIDLEWLLSTRKPEMDSIGAYELPLPINEGIDGPPPHQDVVEQLHQIHQKISAASNEGVESKYAEDFKASLEAFRIMNTVENVVALPIQWLTTYSRFQAKVHQQILAQMQKSLSAVTLSENLLQSVGLWPRVTAKVMLRRLSLMEREQAKTPTPWIVHIRQFANQIVSVQKSRRLLRYCVLKQEDEYARELLSTRDTAALFDYHDWVLVEIEADVCIRTIQMEIAEAMINPPNKDNTVIQLNMGEGKSSVIAPIVAVTLADQTRLVRMVVLKPQSKMMLQLLRQRLSDLANRRIIYLPFSRNIPLDVLPTGTLLSLLKSCQSEGGIWLCQPEHLLSFQLMGLDMAMQGNLNRGYDLSQCQMWMDDNVRDILDESDEILHPRHQLIYTVGSQRSFDGSPNRWELVEDVLSLLYDKMRAITESCYLLLPSQSTTGHPQLRILSVKGRRIFDQLAHSIIFDNAIPTVCLVRAPNLIREAALDFVTSLVAPSATILQEYCHTHTQSSSTLWQSLLLLRGLFAYDILFTAFRSKRYRVDYGLDLTRSQLAVPYRAKDSPSLRSEFSHPDIIIILTCLSYYYHGLTESMLLQAFKSLFKSSSAEQIYQEWVGLCAEEAPVAYQSIDELPMDEQRLISEMWPAFSSNKLVINFYLNENVFPKAAKEFLLKISTSGWDIAKRKTHQVTGFSGTNDSRFLLPTQIVQMNSKEQRHTNATVLSHLLRTDNQIVIPYVNDAPSSVLLNLIMCLSPRPAVLLDVGAQILDKSNLELAKDWLFHPSQDSLIKAAVYFDDEDNLRVLTRDGSIQAFIDSPFNGRLGECIVYLDDVHTRGTDLKLPRCRAAVTLGPRLSKDKLVQGCMRMRKLGTQHSIVFLAPEEVMQSIRGDSEDKDAEVTSFNVLVWSMKETCRALQTDVAVWAVQGHEFVRRQANWKKFRHQIESGVHSSAQKIKDLFCQRDARNLNQLYDIGSNQADGSWLKDYHTRNASSSISRQIFKHCEIFAPFSLADAGMKQEQEIELVNEKEEERQIQRPPPAKPAPHSLHPDLCHFVRTGVLDHESPAFHSIMEAFKHTSLEPPQGITSVFSHILLTNDFCRTILTGGVATDQATNQFLRSVEWVATSQDSNLSYLIILSPYEVNELFNEFKTSKYARLHMFVARTSQGTRSLQDLSSFSLPTDTIHPPISRRMQLELNLFAGTLYLDDYTAYEELCAALRVYHRSLPASIAPQDNVTEIIDHEGFVMDENARMELNLTGLGFDENPLSFLREFLVLRRNGRGLGPSHLGKVLQGRPLQRETDFAKP